MRNRSGLAKSAFVPLCLCLLATGINADMHTAASCSYADVLSAYTACSAGDTVQVPAGSATWNSTLVIKKAVSMIGAGAGLTKFVNSNFINKSFIKIAIPSDAFVRISGICFDLVNNTSGTYSCAIWVIGGNSTAGGTLPDIGNIGITKIRIDHCTFNKGQHQVFWDGWAYGVMDHDSLINGEQSVLLVGDNTHAWTRPIAPGIADAVYIESNVFIADSNFGGGKQDEFIYHQEGARSVTRYNKFDTRGFKKDWAFFDSHGNWGTPLTSYRGQPMIEVYANEFSAYKTYRFTFFRGGSIFFYDNTFTTIQPGSPSTIELSEEESWTSVVCLK